MSSYFVIELQAGETTAYLVDSYSNKDEAEQKYHSILAAAAISTVPYHAAVILRSDGAFIKSESYTHAGNVNPAYVVAELQTTGETTGQIVDVHTSLNYAYQRYYTALAAAAVSEVSEHSAVLLDEKGSFICSKTFRH